MPAFFRRRVLAQRPQGAQCMTIRCGGNIARLAERGRSLQTYRSAGAKKGQACYVSNFATEEIRFCDVQESVSPESSQRTQKEFNYVLREAMRLNYRYRLNRSLRFPSINLLPVR